MKWFERNGILRPVSTIKKYLSTCPIRQLRLCSNILVTKLNLVEKQNTDPHEPGILFILDWLKVFCGIGQKQIWLLRQVDKWLICSVIFLRYGNDTYPIKCFVSLSTKTSKSDNFRPPSHIHLRIRTTVIGTKASGEILPRQRVFECSNKTKTTSTQKNIVHQSGNDYKLHKVFRSSFTTKTRKCHNFLPPSHMHLRKNK